MRRGILDATDTNAKRLDMPFPPLTPMNSQDTLYTAKSQNSVYNATFNPSDLNQNNKIFDRTSSLEPTKDNTIPGPFMSVDDSTDATDLRIRAMDQKPLPKIRPTRASALREQAAKQRSAANSIPNHHPIRTGILHQEPVHAFHIGCQLRESASRKLSLASYGRAQALKGHPSATETQQALLKDEKTQADIEKSAGASKILGPSEKHDGYSITRRDPKYRYRVSKDLDAETIIMGPRKMSGLDEGHSNTKPEVQSSATYPTFIGPLVKSNDGKIEGNEKRNPRYSSASQISERRRAKKQAELEKEKKIREEARKRYHKAGVQPPHLRAPGPRFSSLTTASSSKNTVSEEPKASDSVGKTIPVLATDQKDETKRPDHSENVESHPPIPIRKRSLTTCVAQGTSGSQPEGHPLIPVRERSLTTCVAQGISGSQPEGHPPVPVRQRSLTASVAQEKFQSGNIENHPQVSARERSLTACVVQEKAGCQPEGTNDIGIHSDQAPNIRRSVFSKATTSSAARALPRKENSVDIKSIGQKLRSFIPGQPGSASVYRSTKPKVQSRQSTTRTSLPKASDRALSPNLTSAQKYTYDGSIASVETGTQKNIEVSPLGDTQSGEPRGGTSARISGSQFSAIDADPKTSAGIRHDDKNRSGIDLQRQDGLITCLPQKDISGTEDTQRPTDEEDLSATCLDTYNGSRLSDEGNASHHPTSVVNDVLDNLLSIVHRRYLSITETAGRVQPDKPDLAAHLLGLAAGLATGIDAVRQVRISAIALSRAADNLAIYLEKDSLEAMKEGYGSAP